MDTFISFNNWLMLIHVFNSYTLENHHFGSWLWYQIMVLMSLNMMVKLNTFDLSTDRRKMLRMYKIEKGYLMGMNWLCWKYCWNCWVHEGGAKAQNMLKCVAEYVNSYCLKNLDRWHSMSTTPSALWNPEQSYPSTLGTQCSRERAQKWKW